MSTITNSVDAVAMLNGWLQGLSDMYTADITAIPEDKLTWVPGGCARPANSITAEVIMMCKYAASICRGEEPELKEMEGLQQIADGMTTHAVLVKGIQDAIAEFSTALTSATPETLNKVITPPWQMDAPVYMIAQIMVSHIWYHDGQLNYIQSLLGDEKVHWMG